TNNDEANASSSEEASAEEQNTKDTSNKVTAEGLAQAAQNKNHALQNDDTRAQNTANLLEPEAPQTTQKFNTVPNLVTKQSDKDNANIAGAVTGGTVLAGGAVASTSENEKAHTEDKSTSEQSTSTEQPSAEKRVTQTHESV